MTPPRAGAVFDDEILLQGPLSLAIPGDPECRRFRPCERNDDAHGLGRPALRECLSAPEQQGRGGNAATLDAERRASCEKGCSHRPSFTDIALE